MLDTTNRLEFTDSWVKSVAAPEKGRKAYYDTVSPSLCLIVTHMGAKTFYRAGRPSRIFIGHPDKGWTVKAARVRCNAILGDIAQGKNPVALRKKKKAKRTFGYVFRWYIENYAKVHKKTWRVDEQRWEWVKDWEHRDVSEITRPQFIERLNSLIKERGPNRARHEMTLLNSIFTQAKNNRWIRRRPGRGVPIPKARERNRHVTAEEMPRLFKHLANRPQDFQDFVLLALFTGAREMNILAMERQEIAKGVWTIPASKAKEGVPIAIPIIPAVKEILDRRLAALPRDCQWIFPSKGSKRGHIVTVQRQWAVLCSEKHANLQNLKPHDLRHTLATWMVNLGISKEIIAATLGHGDEKSTDIYAKVTIDPVRAAVTLGVDAISKAAQSKKSQKSPK